jgi:hypothetical protein
MGNKEYFAKWYAENKTALSERRKAKYRNDTEYRDRVLAAPRRARPKREGDAEFVNNQIHCRDGQWRTALVLEGLADQLGVQNETIAKWHQRGIIPATPYFIGRRKYYTQAMADVLMAALVECGYVGKKRIHIRRADSKFSAIVGAKWAELPEFGMC